MSGSLKGPYADSQGFSSKRFLEFGLLDFGFGGLGLSSRGNLSETSRVKGLGLRT